MRLDGEKQREFVMLRWGLIPYWSKDAKSGFATINAMCETIETKPAFREPFQRRRCLILADGFYEWMPTGEKRPRLALPEVRVLGMQGSTPVSSHARTWSPL